MLRFTVLPLAILANTVLAAGWSFDDKFPVSPYSGKNIFPHIDASGRKNIAVSGKYVGIAWEDNHSGSPQIYVTFKKINQNKFSAPVKVSTGKSAYEPTIISIDHGKFVVGWEQDNKILVRQIEPGKSGLAARFGRTSGSQVSLSYIGNNSFLAAWSHKQGRYSRIVISKIHLGKKKIVADRVSPIEQSEPTQNQIYPNIVFSNGVATVVWEDRRRGHTMFLYASAKPGGEFSKPRVLNEIFQKSRKYGSGNGVTRISLASYGKRNIAAAWMDKRNFGTGYDIYAAFSYNAGKIFSKNRKVQDDFAENIAQWHPAIAANDKNKIAIVWDDNRDDTHDIWLTWKTPDGWSQDMAVPPASGDGAQSNPAIAMDNNGNLHLIWLDRGDDNITRLYYSPGRAVNN